MPYKPEKINETCHHRCDAGPAHVMKCDAYVTVGQCVFGVICFTSYWYIYLQNILDLRLIINICIIL